MSLLDKALSLRVNKRDATFTKEELELVEAWLNDEVGITQVAKAMNFKGTGNVYAFIARGAKYMLSHPSGKKR